MSVGFIGLGNIGKPMAGRLLSLQEPVWVYDVAPGPVAELAALGARAASDPRSLARECRIIGLCVRDEQDVESLLSGADGLLANVRPDSAIAVHSTVSQAAILRWAAQARARDVHLIDAPITGGANGAAAATLCYMVGGTVDIVERCRPVFGTSGNRIIHAGATGAGIALKLCNNLMTYAAFTAIHEAAALARAGGLAVELLVEVGRANGVVTPQMEAFLNNRDQLAAQGPAALRQFSASFGALGRKDLAAALVSAARLGLSLPATATVHELIEAVFMNAETRAAELRR